MNHPPDVLLRSELLEKLVGYQLRRTFNLFAEDYRQSVGSLELSQTQVALLFVCREHPGILPSKLAETLGIVRTNIAPILGRFETDGLIRRESGTLDRRTVGVWVTPKGMDLLARVEERVREHEGRLLAPLSAGERATLLNLLAKIRR